MISEYEKEIFKKAYDYFGEIPILIKGSEEFAEAIQAICKYIIISENYEGSYDMEDLAISLDKLIEEIVDAEIMIDQIKLIVKEYGKYYAIRNMKIKRWENRLKESGFIKGNKDDKKDSNKKGFIAIEWDDNDDKQK